MDGGVIALIVALSLWLFGMFSFAVARFVKMLRAGREKQRRWEEDWE